MPVCSYILWKTVAKHLPTPEQRTVFCSGVGEQLLQQLMPDIQQQLQQAATQGVWLQSAHRVTDPYTYCIVIMLLIFAFLFVHSASPLLLQGVRLACDARNCMLALPVRVALATLIASMAMFGTGFLSVPRTAQNVFFCPIILLVGASAVYAAGCITEPAATVPATATRQRQISTRSFSPVSAPAAAAAITARWLHLWVPAGVGQPTGWLAGGLGHE